MKLIFSNNDSIDLGIQNTELCNVYKKIYKNLDDRLTSILLSDRHTILFFGKLSND
jgi:hypothetical protein